MCKECEDQEIKEIKDLPKNKKGNRIDWESTVGINVSVPYNGNIYILKINKILHENQLIYLETIYNDKVYKIKVCDFIKGHIGKSIGLRRSTYKYNINDKISTSKGEILIIDRFKNKKNCRREYKYKCLKCGNEDTMSEYQINNKGNCNVCAGQKILKGYNDLWTTNPEVAKLLKYPEEGYELTTHSNKRVTFICPDCGKEKNAIVNDITRRKFSCKYCRDSISYPEKYVISLLNQLHLDFKHDCVLNWSGTKRYDFYIQSLNCIIETHGEQHYDDKSNWNNCGSRTLEEEQENDRFKEKLAKDNGIKSYVIIDCRNSESEYIKNNILYSELKQLLNIKEGDINWLKCEEFALGNLVKKACDLWNSGIHSSNDISNLLSLNVSTAIDYLKKGAKIGLCDYSKEKSLKERSDKMRGKNHPLSKKVICLNDGKIFDSIARAEKEYHVSNISQCCNNHYHNVGGISNNNKLVFMYYSEYLNSTQEEINDKLNKDKLNHKGKYHSQSKKVICLNTGEVFDSIRSASEIYSNSNAITISKVCKGQAYYSGKLEEKTYLQWQFYEDWIKEPKILLTNSEINNLIYRKSKNNSKIVA